jgi:hypothetical protein
MVTATFANPFYKKNNKTQRNNNNNRNNSLDKYIIDNYDELLNEQEIKRHMRSPVNFNSGRRSNAVKRTLKRFVSSFGLEDRVSKLLVEYIIKKNSGLTEDQKANILTYRMNNNSITKLVKNIYEAKNYNLPNITKNYYNNQSSRV